jgi:hypothetical protein
MISVWRLLIEAGDVSLFVLYAVAMEAAALGTPTLLVHPKENHLASSLLSSTVIVMRSNRNVLAASDVVWGLMIVFL